MNEEEYYNRRFRLNAEIQKSEEMLVQYRKQKRYLESCLEDCEWELRKSERLYSDIEEYWREKNLKPECMDIFENENEIRRAVKQKIDTLYQDCNEMLQMQIRSEEDKQEEYHNQMHQLRKELWNTEEPHGENN